VDVWVQIALTSLNAVLASSGFWAFLRSRSKSAGARDRLTMGIAYDKITSYGLAYIDRGWITKEESAELRKFFYEPYRALGGNGTAEQIMEQVADLPFSTRSKYAGILPAENERFINNVRVITPPRSREEAPSE
jgi:hypothetical protein